MAEASRESADISRQGRFNGIVIAVLVVVGLLGAWAMFTNLYQTTPAVAPKWSPASQSAPAANPAVAAAPVAAEAPKNPPASGQYALQLSPFSELATAEELRAKLQKLDIPSTLRLEAHVQVGPFRTPEEAEAARARLKEMGVYGGQTITLK